MRKAFRLLGIVTGLGGCFSWMVTLILILVYGRFVTTEHWFIAVPELVLVVLGTALLCLILKEEMGNESS